MKIIILLLLFSLNLTSIHAQTSQKHKWDSLQLALQQEKTDTGRVILLAEFAFQLHETKPDTAMLLAFEALSLSKRIGFEKGEAVSLNRVGNVYRITGNYPKAMEAFLKALKINEKINNPDGLRRNYNNIGGIYQAQGDYHQALIYLFKAKDLGERQKHNEGLSICLVNMGVNYLGLKKFDSATIYANQALIIATQINYDRQIGGALQVLGGINVETGKYSLALEYYRLSFYHSEKAENYFDLCVTSLGVAKLFQMIQQKDSALFYARQSMKIAKEKGFIKEVRDAGRFLSSYYRNIRFHDSAYFYQDVTKAANDSLFNEQKNNQMQSLVFDEKLRQQEVAIANLKAKEERNHNLQYAAIAVALITFIILFLVLSRSIIVKQKFIEFFAILGLLAVFEFINLFIHPYLSNITNHSPVLMLIILIAIGALLIPLHHKLEKWITKIMIEKNKKIRLEAARKTIATLEGENS